MNILIAGGSGFIGSFLCDFLRDKGHNVTILTRSSLKKSALQWDGKTLKTDQSFDVIINLCGQGIADKRWTATVKKQLETSRLVPTQAIVSFIMSCPEECKPRLINASAIGFYPSTDQVQTEDNFDDLTYNLFSQKLVQKWERCARQASAYGASVTVLRFGVVLGNGGGMLKKVLPTFKMGLGAVMGNKESSMSWIHINDLCRAIDFVMQMDSGDPAFNVTAPMACTQQEFAKALAAACSKPCLLSMPPMLIKFMFGQMGEELLLANQKIYPEKLLNAGFKFEYPDIASALHDLIKLATNKVV